MIEDRKISRAVSQIKLRSDRFDDSLDYGRTFVDGGVIDELDNQNHQVLFGRRGTGKTHALKVLQNRLENEENTVVIFVDARTLGSTEQFANLGVDHSSICLGHFRDILTRIHWGVLDYLVEKADVHADRSIDLLDEFLSATSEPVEQLELNRLGTERQYERHSDVSFAATASSTPVSQIKAAASRKTDSKVALKADYNVRTDNHVSFPRIISALSDILELNRINLYLFIDEWSSISWDLQPALADLLKRSISVCKRVTFKIAAIEARTNFSLVEGNFRAGFELGADIFSAPHLDDYYIYERDAEGVTDIYMQVIFNHLKNQLPFDYLQKRFSVSDGSTLADRVLAPKAAIELARSAEGVMRDLLNVFIIALNRAAKVDREHTGRIEAIHVAEAAYQWFERDKLQSIARDTSRALAILERKLVGELRVRFFAVPMDAPKSRLLLNLVDARLIHLVWKNMAHPGGTGSRHVVYCLDYGSCLSVVRGADRYRLNAKYYDIMDQIALTFDRVGDFDLIVTTDLFGADVPPEDIVTSPD